MILDVRRIRLLDLRHAESLGRVPELDESLGITVGEGPEQDGVDDAERGGRAGDAKPEGDHADSGEAGRAGQAPKRRPDLRLERHQHLSRGGYERYAPPNRSFQNQRLANDNRTGNQRSVRSYLNVYDSMNQDYVAGLDGDHVV